GSLDFPPRVPCTTLGEVVPGGRVRHRIRPFLYPPVCPQSAVMAPIDTLILNASIATMDPARPAASALAAFGGRIAAIGETADLRGLAGRGTQIVDAGGARIIPGIVDSHAHPDAYAIRLRSWTLLSPDRVRTREEVLGTI